MIVMVTGADGSLGRAVCRKLNGAGHVVIGVDRSQSGATEFEDLRLSGVDLTDEEDAASAARSVVDRFGSIDGLANIAGGFVWTPVGEAAADVWTQMWNINLRTALVTTRSVIAATTAVQSIVNVGALAAQQAAAGMGPYAAAKAGVLRMTEALAEEMKASGTRVNAILPSIIDTPDNRRDMPDADVSAWVTPGEAANLVAFLISAEASAITGAGIPVRGRL